MMENDSYVDVLWILLYTDEASVIGLEHWDAFFIYIGTAHKEWIHPIL